MIIRHFLSNSLKTLQKHVPLKPFLPNPSLNSSFSTTSGPFSEKPKPEYTKYFQPPKREPFNDKDDPGSKNTYVEFTKEMYLDFIDEKNPKVVKQRSCYYALERNGEIYHVFDASRIPYGRMCVKIASFLQGKHKPTYIRNKTGTGDHCIVVNALNIKMNGLKKLKKKLTYHSGFVGHLKQIPYRKFMEEKPEHLIHYTVNKMLPKNKLRMEYLGKLKIFREEIDMPGFPNFLTFNPYTFNPLVHEPLSKRISKDDAVVVWESEPGYAEEFKDFKREEDTEPNLDLKDRQWVPKSTAENKALLKKYKRHVRLARRYKEFKFKPRKNNDPRTKDFYMIKSVKHIKKYHLDELKDCLVEEAEDDEEDDTMK